MKINSEDYNELVKYLKDHEYKPKVSGNLFKKISRFSIEGDILKYKGKIMIPQQQIAGLLKEKVLQYPFGTVKLYHTLFIDYEGISIYDVERYLKNNTTSQVHTVPKVERVHKPIISNYPLERVQADLIDLDSIKGYNNRYRYVLTIIDHFSKYAWAYPITKKDKEHVLPLFEKWLDSLGNRKVRILQTDGGGEFLNDKMTLLLKKHEIEQITSSPYSPRSQGCIERFNRTLKQMIFKTITETNRKDFIHYLDDLLISYVNSYHTTIKNKPSVIFATTNTENILKQSEQDEQEQILKETSKNIKQFAKSMIVPYKNSEKLKVGEFVRISKMTESATRKQRFLKKYTKNYSDEVYKIISVGKKTNLCRLKDVQTGEKLERGYYFDQLLRIDYTEVKKNDEAEKPAQEIIEISSDDEQKDKPIEEIKIIRPEFIELPVRRSQRQKKQTEFYGKTIIK